MKGASLSNRSTITAIRILLHLWARAAPLLLLLTVPIQVACRPDVSPLATGTPPPVRILYLAREGGRLQESDLAAHPQVMQLDSFEAMQALVQQRARATAEGVGGRFAPAPLALWIDRNAADMVDGGWLHEEPQKWYPLVLIGSNNAQHAFKEMLDGFPIIGPQVDWSKHTLEPGFSVWVLREDRSGSVRAIMQGHDTRPSVQAILDVTQPYMLPASG